MSAQSMNALMEQEKKRFAGAELAGKTLGVVEGGLGPGVKISAAIAVCGSLPVYTLGFASHRTPAAVVVAWQVHTAAQLLAGGVVLDAMG